MECFENSYRSKITNIVYAIESYICASIGLQKKTGQIYGFGEAMLF